MANFSFSLFWGGVDGVARSVDDSTWASRRHFRQASRSTSAASGEEAEALPSAKVHTHKCSAAERRRTQQNAKGAHPRASDRVATALSSHANLVPLCNALASRPRPFIVVVVA